MNTKQSDALFALILLFIAIILFILALWAMFHYFDVFDGHSNTVEELENNTFTPASQLEALSKQVQQGNQYPNKAQSTFSNLGKTQTLDNLAQNNNDNDSKNNPVQHTNQKTPYSIASDNSSGGNGTSHDTNTHAIKNSKIPYSPYSPSNALNTNVETDNDDYSTSKVTNGRNNNIHHHQTHKPMDLSIDNHIDKQVSSDRNSHSTTDPVTQGNLLNQASRIFDCINPINQQAQLQLVNTTNNSRETALVFYTDMTRKIVDDQLHLQTQQATHDAYFIQHTNSEEIIMKDSRYWYRFIQFDYPSEGVKGIVSIASIRTLGLINQYECVGDTKLMLSDITASDYGFLPINDTLRKTLQRFQQ